MEYSKEFEEWYRKSLGDMLLVAKPVAWAAWEASRKDHYLIGEKVEVRWGESWKEGSMVARVENTGYADDSRSVRRVPEWEPKEGEAVLFNYHGTTKVGLYIDGWITSRDRKINPACYEFIKLTPADTDKIGKPWNDI